MSQYLYYDRNTIFIIIFKIMDTSTVAGRLLWKSGLILKV